MSAPVDASLAPAITTVLRRQGPTDELRLASLLLQAGLDVGGDRLAEGIARAGAVTIAGPDGPLLALPTGPRATPAQPVVTEPNRIRDLLVQTPPRVLLAILVVLLVLAIALLASLNQGKRGAPTIQYNPPTTAPVTVPR